MLSPWLEVRPVDVLDVALVSVLFSLLIVWMRRARAGLPLLGMAILGGVYLAARQLDMHLTAWIFQGFFAIFVIVLVVIFQRELRQIFERIAVFGMGRRLGVAPGSETQDCVVRAALELQRQGIGALVVVCGRDAVERFLEGGVPLDGRVSDALLASLFDPHSVGHDGALVIHGDRAVVFSAQLPLSTDFAQLGSRGTRHAAALGLAERTDALCLVVSEERGTLSIARDGRLRTIASPADLEAELREFEALARPTSTVGHRWGRALRRHGVESVAGIALAVGLWVAFVPGSQVLERSFEVPVVAENVPPGFAVERIDPASVELRLSGLRRDFVLLDPATVGVKVDANAVGMGRRSFELDREDLVLPPGFAFVAVKPQRVRLQVKLLPPGTENGASRSGAAQPGVASR